MDPPSRPRHLDAAGGMEVVYCHSCRNEWYRNEYGLRCPRCDGEITEIVTPGEDDPRHEFADPLDDLGHFDRTPPTYHHHRPGSDNEQDARNIEERAQRGPAYYLQQALFGGPPRPPNRPTNDARPPDPRRQSPSPNPVPIPNQGRAPEQQGDPTDRTFVLRRFQEMLVNDFRVGATGRSGRDTLFPQPPMGHPPVIFQRQMTYSTGSGGRGGVTMSFSSGNQPGQPSSRLDQMFNDMLGIGSSSPADSGSIPITQTTGVIGYGTHVGQDLASILNALLSTLDGPNAVRGDAVYTQEAMDRILTQLMEENQGSNAPPPASQEAIDRLPRKKLDKDMLPEGRGECTICIQDVHIGEEVVVLPCSHWFHEDCIIYWLREHGTCPICRQIVEPDAGNGSGSGSSQPGQPSGSLSGPGSGSGPSYSRQRDPLSHTSFSSSPSGQPSGSANQTSRSSTQAARMARLNANRSTAGLPRRSITPSSNNARRYRTRSRSPDLSGGTERRRRSHSSHGHVSSMLASTDRERDRHRSRYFAFQTASRNRDGQGDRNNTGEPILGWLRNQFQGRSS